MTVLNIIEQKQDTKEFTPVLFKVLPLNASQEQALKEVHKNTLTTVIGAAGTGKSSTITAIASDFIVKGKKVLIVSKSNHAVDVICEKMNDLGSGLIASRGGCFDYQVKLSSYIMDLLENKIDLTHKEKSNILFYILRQDTTEAKKILKEKRIKALNSLLNDIENRKNLLVQAKSLLSAFRSPR